MKYMIIIFSLISFSAMAQIPGPVAGKDTISGETGLILWQANVRGTSGNLNSSDGYSIKIFEQNPLPTRADYSSPEGWNLRPIRLIDTLNSGEPLLNTIFASPVIMPSSTTLNPLSVTESQPINFGNANIEEAKTMRVLIRNAGNSPLNMPIGKIYDSESGFFDNNASSGWLYISRKDANYAAETEWQTRQTEPEPIQGQALMYADSSLDNVTVSIAPGDTAGFWLDARPLVLGMKKDTMKILTNTGFGSINSEAPMSVIGNWTVNYMMGLSKARPSTRFVNGFFKDTLKILDNNSEKTRIASFQICIKFNPRNIGIDSVKMNQNAFPDGWSWDFANISETEKYGYIYILAQADTNLILKQTATSPNQLSYLTAGSNSQINNLAYIYGRQLLGVSDTTWLEVDTSRSFHNYSKDYLFDTDSEIFDMNIPALASIDGLVVADSLMLKDKLLLDSQVRNARINSLYPNPAPYQGIAFARIDVISDEINLNYGLIDPYTGQRYEIGTNENFNNGINLIEIDLIGLEGKMYLFYINFGSYYDVRLLNINK